ncbi:MAG: M24 family metallopeptidase [Christensenellales bacterium]
MNYSFFKKNAQKVRDRMREEGIDVMILTHQQKYSYVAGTYHNDFNLGNCIFLWADQEPTLLVALGEHGRLQTEGYIKDLRVWAPAYAGITPHGFCETAIDILNERGYANKTIAVEMPSISYIFLDHLKRNLPEATIIDGEDMINHVMMLKDEEELELIRRACAIADAGTRQIIENARVGVTEAELMGYAEKEMRRLGAAYYYTPNQCLFTSARGGGDHIPTDKILVPGDRIYYDLHPVWHEYRTDSFRTLAFGKQSKSFMKMVEFMVPVIGQLNKMMVPGASTTEIEKWYLSTLKSGGYPDYGSVPLGHGIGTGHLPPTFYHTDDYALEENVMVVPCAHIYDLVSPDGGVFALEYVVCVKKGGAEVFTKYPLDLITIDC